MNPFEFLKRDGLGAISDPRHAKKFASNPPFPHIVLDNLFRDDVLKSLAHEFPNPAETKWWEYSNPLERKLAFNDLSKLPRQFHDFFDFMSSSFFISFLERLSGIDSLIPDPDLNGGGLHQIMRDGKLDVHEDYNIHKGLKAFRKVNAILYLNENWDETYGGHLELWNKEMSACVQKISPIFNRLVIFRTDTDSNHGHPEPLACPEGFSRKSLATYYYVRSEDVDKTPYHSTIFKRRPTDPVDPSIEELRRSRSQGRIPT